MVPAGNETSDPQWRYPSRRHVRLRRGHTLGRINRCVGRRSPLDFHRKLKGSPPLLSLETNIIFAPFWFYFWRLATAHSARVQRFQLGDDCHWGNWMGGQCVYQLPTRARQSRASSQEIPSNLWSRQLIVLDLWWRIADSQRGTNPARVLGNMHASALCCGEGTVQLLHPVHL